MIPVSKKYSSCKWVRLKAILRPFDTECLFEATMLVKSNIGKRATNHPLIVCNLEEVRSLTLLSNGVGSQRWSEFEEDDVGYNINRLSK